MTQTMTPPTGAPAPGWSWHAALTEHARTHPDEPAVVDPTAPGRPATYGELLRRVEGLAARLRTAGVSQDEVVAAVSDRSVDGVVAMLGILLAGGAYCPIDEGAPPERTAAALERLGVRVVVGGGEAPVAAAQVVDPRGPDVAGPDHPAPPAPDSLAYVLHTSGSTGRPKAVGMTHRGLDRLIGWQVADGPRGLRTVQFTATSFDVTFQEVLSTVSTGGTLVLAPERVRRDPDALLDLVVDQHAERLFLPYVALQLLAAAARRRALWPSSLRHVVTAGERLVATPAIRALFGALPQCRLDNHYGPTEAHLATRFTLAGGTGEWPAAPPIGAPVAGVTCAVLDERMAAVGDGEVGELYLGGSGLARGYVGDAAQTATRFVADPTGSGTRLYRTGDLVRAGSQGLEFLGRDDRQLKVRGFRVEPAEVEGALLHHPQVEAAAVGLRDLAPGVPGLVGYLQTRGPAPHRELVDHLRGLVPEHLVPARFVLVDSLPRTSSGKVDAQALAALELPEAGPSGAGTSLADTVTAIWRRVLGHDEFDAHDDFFDIGGDSLLATWVVAEMAQELGSTLGLSVFLDDSTVSGLVGALAEQGARAEGRARCSAVMTLRPGPSVRSLHLLHPLGGEPIAYRALARASRAPYRLLGVARTGPVPRGTSLEELARTHVEQLRAARPDGPYLLAGWSFGGVLAYEVARQLRDAGVTVDLLGMVDANPLVDPLTGLPMAETPFREMLDGVLSRLDDPTCSPDDVVELTSGRVWTQLMGAPLTGGTPTDYLRTVLLRARACMDAAMRYTPRPYGGPVTLFQPAGSDPGRQARLAEALRGLCTGPFTTVPVAGDHHSVMHEPDVADLAARLDAALENSGTETAGALDGS